MTKLKEHNNYKIKFIVLSVVFVVAFFASFMLGRYKIYPFEVIKIILNGICDKLSYFTPSLKGAFYDSAIPTQAYTVVFNVRLPRIIAAVLIGAALSVSGAAYQGMFRNPMVSPDILGASGGAGFGAALAILLGFGYAGVSASSFCFGLVAVLAAFIMSKAGNGNSTLSLVLAGMMINSLFSSGTSFIKLIADTQSQLPAITYWLMGSLTSIKPGDTLFLFVTVLLGLMPIILLSWRINLLTSGDDEARSMGVNVSALKIVIIICATFMTAACVSVSGMIGWVGLVIPHFCRRLFGYDYKRIIPGAILLGSSFLLITDDIARVAVASEIPIGILTSFVGAPVFIYMIIGKGERYEY
ncbi:MAG: iron ABC transporter permease [Clostridiales bacterium]|nr:iron ABC transporter permease [Clostridiales bacterium]